MRDFKTLKAITLCGSLALFTGAFSAEAIRIGIGHQSMVTNTIPGGIILEKLELLAGEIISGQYGIGYYTWNSYTLIQYPQIIIGMLTIGGLGTLCTLLVRKGCNPLLKWQAKGGRS